MTRQQLIEALNWPVNRLKFDPAAFWDYIRKNRYFTS